MIVFPESNSVWIDVDDTLVLWAPTQEQKDKFGIDITCPGSMVWDRDGSEIGFAPDWTEKLVPHKVHIEQIKRHKMRGQLVVVWSQGGANWAHAVVKALKLEQFVDLVIGKPTWIIDDKDPSFWMPKPFWLEDKE